MGLKNQSFHDYFQNVYGDRWENIFKALQYKNQSVYRKNKFANFLNFDFNQVQQSPHFANSYNDNSENEQALTTLTDDQNLSLFYKMDPASQFVAESLEVKRDSRVLDMCAAPGGKSLILAESLNGTGEFLVNEISKDRRERLNRVVHQYIPHDLRQNTFVKGLDGNQYGLRFPDYFDSVLCDVPCSGERHLVENEKEFNQWTLNRSKNLAVRQFSLLSSAWLCCRSGGRIVYSTCSLSPLENDEVVKKLVKRRGVKIERSVVLESYHFIEKTDFGYQILPDILGFGPMYFSIMLKA
jgi:5-methylcytosine rRNA methyltransferase NSUN4